MLKKKKRLISSDYPTADKKSTHKTSKNRVRELRKERKWTQWQLAKISGLSQRTIQRIECSGSFGVTAEIALANAFEIGVPELYDSRQSDSTVDFLFLKRLVSGSALLNLIQNSEAARFEIDNSRLNDNEAELVSDFMQSLKVWGMKWKDIDTSECINIGNLFSSKLEELNGCGLWVFGESVKESFPEAKVMQVARILIQRSDDLRIIRPKALGQFGRELCGIVVPLAGSKA